VDRELLHQLEPQVLVADVGHHLEIELGRESGHQLGLADSLLLDQDVTKPLALLSLGGKSLLEDLAGDPALLDQNRSKSWWLHDLRLSTRRLN